MNEVMILASVVDVGSEGLAAPLPPPHPRTGGDG